MSERRTCPSCRFGIPTGGRYCLRCGTKVDENEQERRAGEHLNIRILYIMVGILILAVFFPPWEAAPGEPPQFLGLSFILSPPREGAIVSRILQTIQLVSIATGGMYAAWFFRSK